MKACQYTEKFNVQKLALLRYFIQFFFVQRFFKPIYPAMVVDCQCCNMNKVAKQSANRYDIPPEKRT